MNLGLGGHAYHGKRGMINAALSAASVALLALTLWIWTYNPHLPHPTEGGAVKTGGGSAKGRALQARAYDVIVDKDIFRPSRARYIAPVRPKPLPPPAPPPPPKPVPKLTLIGTVLLDDGEAAIIDYAGGQKAAFYRVGDSIEEFVIKEIRKDTVVLERDGEVIKAVMSRGPSPSAQAATPAAVNQQAPSSPSMQTPQSAVKPVPLAGR